MCVCMYVVYVCVWMYVCKIYMCIIVGICTYIQVPMYEWIYVYNV